MAVYNFNRVDVALLGYSQGTRLSIRDALHSNGIRRIHDAATPEQLRRVILSVEPDLVMLHLDADVDAVAEVVRDIRHGRLGPNPYLVAFGLTWRAERAIVGAGINAGVDDVITLPISIAALFDRLDNIIQRRKEFVVTTDYIGPDRRQSRRPANDDLGTFGVPNVLREKVKSDRPVEIDVRAITRANQMVSHHRLRRLTTRLSQLATQHELTAETRGVEAVPEEALNDMTSLLARITGALEAEGYEHLLELAYSMQDAIGKVRRKDNPTIEIFKLLKLHGQAVSASLKSSADASEQVLSALNLALDFTDRRPQRQAVAS